MIEARGVSKHYGDLAALSDVSFDLASGEIVGLLGPNGAGKTTLLRVLTGYFEPTAGSIRIDGLDVEADPIGVQQRIGYLPEQTPLYPEMLVQEYLEMVADFRDLSPNRRTPLLSVIRSLGSFPQLDEPATLRGEARVEAGLRTPQPPQGPTPLG